MQIRIIKIGNSRAVRIRKAAPVPTRVDKETDLGIRPVRRVREGWSKAFRAMAERGEDRLFEKENCIGQNSWDDEEWEW